MGKVGLFAALVCGVCFTAKAIPFAKCREMLAANIRRCQNCGRKYDLSELSYTAKSWKIHYCREKCAREAGELK